MCTSSRCTGNSPFLQDIYLDTMVVFFGFSANPGTCTFLHVCGIIIISVHHADAPEISHFSKNFTWTPELFFFWVFCTSTGHVLNGVSVNVGGNMLFSF